MKHEGGVSNHAVVSHEAWLTARTAFLKKEKEFTRQRDELSRLRRELPWERVDKAYMFDAPGGKESLAELFGKRSQLAVYHFMFDPDLGRRLPALLVLGRQLQRHRCAPRAPRRELRRDLARPPRQARGVQEAHGLELRVGVVVRYRLQPRLRRVLHAGSARERPRHLQLQARRRWTCRTARA